MGPGLQEEAEGPRWKKKCWKESNFDDYFGSETEDEFEQEFVWGGRPVLDMFRRESRDCLITEQEWRQKDVAEHKLALAIENKCKWVTTR